jgi:acyl transferase domain-containing protein/acyl carrier protein
MNLLHYILSEVKNKRLPKADAIGLIRQHQSQALTGEQRSLHPLVHQNTSDLSEQRFSSLFNGDEFFLADHRVQGQSVLPGVAYLEMARVAAEQAGAGQPEEAVTLRNVVFVRPVVVNQQPVRVHVGLYPQEGAEIGFEVYGGEAGQVHCRGSVRYVLREDGAPAVLDLTALRAQCNRPSLGAAQCYQAFTAMGLEYGAAHRAVQEVHVADHLVLARLELPASLADTADQFTLHPSLMDGALQASAGLLAGQGGANRPTLPFAIDEVQVLSACTLRMWSLVRRSPDCNPTDRVQKLDIDLCDEQGRLCVRLRGFSTRVLEAGVAVAEAAVPEAEAAIDPAVQAGRDIDRSMLAPVWDAVPPAELSTPAKAPERVVLVGAPGPFRDTVLAAFPGAPVVELGAESTTDDMQRQLEALGPIEHLVWTAPQEQAPSLQDDRLIAAQERGVMQCFRLIKALLALGHAGQPLGFTLITQQVHAVRPGETPDPAHASLTGLVGSMAKEMFSWQVRHIDVGAGEAAPLARLFALPADPQRSTWAWRAGQWYVQKLLVTQVHAPAQPLCKPSGVYVVIGGAGGLGVVWTEHVIRTQGAQVVWLGRRPMNEDIQRKIDRLAALGPAPQYRVADAGDQASLQNACDEIKQQHGRIDGVVHSALALLDKSLALMDEERFRAGLAAKVDICVRLAQVFAAEPLSFVLFFSSMQSFIKSAGQSNYAAGCTFKDEFAQWLGAQLPCPVKVMNWGYWGGVGIVSSDAYKERMARMGIGSIEPEEGMAALDLLMDGPLSQMALFKTTQAVMGRDVPTDERAEFYRVGPASLSQALAERLQSAGSTPVEAPAPKPEPVVDADLLATKVEAVLIGIAADVLGVPADTLLPEGSLQDYGFDPTLLTEQISRFNEQCGLALPANALFGGQNLREFARQVTAEHLPALSGQLPQQGVQEASQETPEEARVRMERIRDDVEAHFCDLLSVQLGAAGLLVTKPAVGMPPVYGRWLDESHRVLCRSGHLALEGDALVPTGQGPRSPEEAWARWNDSKPQWLQDPATKAQVSLAEVMLRALPEILLGKVPATDVMFPGSSMALVEGVYKHNPVADHFNAVLARAVVSFVEERRRQDPEARVRILEIGAGTGGTSVVVLERLNAYRDHVEDYSYTDISKAFLFHGQKRFGEAHPFVSYQLFDVGRPLAAQGVQPAHYDLVIATNVLHATHSVRTSLRNAKAALRSNGLILLNEISENLLFTHLTFGLLEGWWMHEDAELRIPGCPALSPEGWASVLRDEGFRSVLFPAQSDHGLGQQIVIAESDGRVRQALLEATPPAPAPATPSMAVVPVAQAVPAPVTGQRSSGAVSPHLRERSVGYFKKLLGDTLKIPTSRIDASETLDKYGIDSLLVVQLTEALRNAFGNISSTLFFEYQTIDALVDHFLATQPESLTRLVGLDVEDAVVVSAPDAGPKASRSAVLPALAADGPSRRTRRFRNADRAAEGASTAPKVQDIAIIGLSGRYPNAADPAAFWQNIKDGRNCISEVPRDRWDWKKYYGEEKGKFGTIYTKWGGFLPEIDKFDPLFFQISPREAEVMSPQERMMIEEVHASIEDAGYGPTGLCESRKVGVFIGVMNETYPTGARHWSIANRVSYAMNFQGPSLAVDTACSSSLTAIHLALESLYSGTSDCAIAGGVNVIIDPFHYMGLSAATMLSPTDKCKAFGAGADGFVDGEAVGAIVLKPLHKAVADGDHIYGVIKGSMVNAGGKTNGYSVPNPNAQYQLVADALQRARVHPKSVSYVEAHGTGTFLGDPIEIAGLTRAFRKHTQDKQYCAIGSVKSNIGHCESAAGIAGVTKVLLQMKHRTLVPSLHSAELNPNIDFASTPFKVQQTLQEWKRPLVELDGTTKEFPRIAGVSSFGAGGANAHVVIEEFSPTQARPAPFAGSERPPCLVVLSARNADRLQARARQLGEAIAAGRFAEEDLPDMAYTLQVGREAMEVRLGLAVSSLGELKERLAAFVQGEREAEGLYLGEVKRNREALVAFAADEDMASITDAWIAKGKFGKLLDVWVKGLPFDWARLYGSVRPRRISLPTYPFTKERYWVAGAGPKFGPPRGAAGVAMLHPLVHQNTSDLSEQRYSSSFTGDEFFLADHRVQGVGFLPGVAYLEMARAAAVKAAASGSNVQVTLKNVVFVRPLVAGSEPVQVHVGLYPQQAHELAFEVYSQGQEQVHCQGVVQLVEESASPVELPVLDLVSLRAQCTRLSLSAAVCYEAFGKMGLQYGSGHQALQEVLVGDAQVLARLELPASVAGSARQYVLHPSLMDGALQAAIGLLAGHTDGEPGKPVLPFALEALQVLGPCGDRMWSFVRPSPGSTADDRVRKLDIDVCDDEGRVCVSLRGFSSRVLDATPTASATRNADTVLFQPEWQAQAQAAAAQGDAESQRLVLLCGWTDATVQQLQHSMPGARCIGLPTTASDIAQRFEEHTQQTLAHLVQLQQDAAGAPALVQVVVPALGEPQLLAGLGGMLKAAQGEQPRLRTQLIELEALESEAGLLSKLEHSRQTLAVQQRHQDGELWAMRWKELGTSAEPAAAPWKPQGVYLITGGAGGLGLVLANDIARRAPGARLVLTGRTELSSRTQGQLDDIARLGAQVDYQRVDVSNREQVGELVRGIVQAHGRLDGIVHSAGVTRDSLIAKKTVQDVQDVLQPKVAGLMNLDEASKDLTLGCFICFSSVAGALGNIGQADYAAANAFMDRYALYRNTLAALQQRHGRALSVNWPLWQDGGMKLNAASEKMLAQTTGMAAMPADAGLAALDRAWASGADQVLVLHGDRPRMLQKVLNIGVPAPAAAKAPQASPATTAAFAGGDDGEMLAKIRSLLVTGVSNILKVKPEDIDSDAELNEYGFDSITLTEFGTSLNQDYQLELAPTVFFEHTTLNKFAQYLAENHRATFASKFGSSGASCATRNAAERPAAKDTAPPAARSARARHRARFAAGSGVTPSAEDAEPIAVIGMSGRFPMAKDVHEFWQNLIEGKDCIAEIPRDRWDWRQYYGDPHKEANKTNVKWGGFIDEVSEFDPLFFGISPKEAELMDPQQRLLMMHVWRALEDAGYSASSVSGTNLAIFAGTANTGYGGLVARAGVAIEGHSSTGSVSSVGPNRMSYFLNVHGPSEPIETACSSSLIAIRRGMLSIRNGDCESAVVGGINTILMPEMHISFNKAGMLCEDGRCKTFSAQANGYVRGEGVGMLVLKKLSAAEADGDNIYAVLRGSAENHGGRSNSLTAPNPKAQAELLKTAYRKAGIDPRTVSYIEAHGTGTALGDPIEINGLKAAFQEMYKAAGSDGPATPHCGLGSVKTNIGHLELAAGVAGVIKVLLQLKHKTLVKSLHSEEINPYIDLKDSPFYIVQETREWTALKDEHGRDLPRRAGVSSFGFGGANAHVVLEEYVPRIDTRASEASGAPSLIVLSAKNVERLQDQARQLADAIDAGRYTDDDLPAMAYTLQVGREAMEERMALIVDSVADLGAKLQAFAAGQSNLDRGYRGQAKRNKEALGVFAVDEELQDAIDKWVQRGKFGKLLDLWVKGLVFDWTKLYGENKPRRISLPCYPFAKERCWVTDASGFSEPSRSAGAAPQAAPRPSAAMYDTLIDQLIRDELSVEQAVMQIAGDEDGLF